MPLTRIGERDSRFTADVSVGKNSLRLLVDTGAAATFVRPDTVQRQDLKAFAGRRIATFTGADDPPYRLVALADLRVGKVVLPAIPAEVRDLAGPHPATDGKDAVRIDGILGHDLLTHLSAVIDYEKPALYVISPTDREWPKLQGEWTCVGGARDGKPLADADRWRFHFDGKRQTHLVDAGAGTDALLGLDFLSLGRHRVMTVERGKATKAARLPFEQEAIWMQYVVRGDTLTVAFLLRPKDTAVLTDRIPATLESKADSGVVVLTFARQPKQPEKK